MLKAKKIPEVCRKCKKELKKQDEPIQVRDFTFCKDCFGVISAWCYTCRKPIYKNESFYEITPSWSAEHIFGISHSEKIIQCDLCRDLSLIEQKNKRKWKNQAKWILGFYAILFLSIILFLLYPTLEKNWVEIFYKKVDEKQVLRLWKPWVVCGIILALSSIIVSTLYWVISVEFVIRYKNRFEEEWEKGLEKKKKEREKQKSKKKKNNKK